MSYPERNMILSISSVVGDHRRRARSFAEIRTDWVRRADAFDAIGSKRLAWESAQFEGFFSHLAHFEAAVLAHGEKAFPKGDSNLPCK